MNFGEFIKERRLELNMSLRKFCDVSQIDASNWSKIERSQLPLSLAINKLEELAKVLKIERDSVEWVKYFDLATVAKGIIPKDVYNDNGVLEALPVFFRTASNNKPSDEELDKLIAFIQERRHG